MFGDGRVRSRLGARRPLCRDSVPLHVRRVELQNRTRRHRTFLGHPLSARRPRRRTRGGRR